MKSELQVIAIEIFKWCMVNNIVIEIEWLPRKENERADYLSRIIEKDDWGISFEILHFIENRWGKLEVDWFASEHNAKLAVFYSRFQTQNCTGVDAFIENWGNVFGLFVPPVILVSRVIKQMKAQSVKGVLVVPAWKSANFWPLLCTREGYFVKHVQDWFDLPTGKQDYCTCKNGSGIFGKINLPFRMLAIYVDFTIV